MISPNLSRLSCAAIAAIIQNRSFGSGQKVGQCPTCDGFQSIAPRAEGDAAHHGSWNGYITNMELPPHSQRDRGSPTSKAIGKTRPDPSGNLATGRISGAS